MNVARLSTVWVLTHGITGMHTEVLPGKEKVVNELKQLAEKADHIYLATDLDREGEAIAGTCGSDRGDDKRYSRVVFNEITKNAIRRAFEKPVN